MPMPATDIKAALEALAGQTPKRKPRPKDSHRDDARWDRIVAAWQAAKAVRKEHQALEDEAAEALREELACRGDDAQIVTSSGTVTINLVAVREYTVPARVDRRLAYRPPLRVSR